MRLFFGVFPPPPVRDEVVRALERVRRSGPSVRWAGQAKWHVTLQFLGELDEQQRATAEQIAREIAPLQARFSVAFRGLGVFPDERHASVLWLGLRESEGLRVLADALHASLVAAGFSLDERPYHPHLTLARIKTRKEADEVRAILAQAPRVESSAFDVGSFALIESRGGAYLPLTDFTLATAR